MPSELSHSVLDEPQFARITATHRGFLYQHLYCVACLLRAQSFGYTIVRVEADEDLELWGEGRSLYVQIKTRSVPLTPSDIKDTLQRFDEIRKAHKAGNRPGQASLVIVANVEAGQTLKDQQRNGVLPSDVELVLGVNANPTAKILIPPPSNIEALFTECVRTASALLLSALRPSSLVWKLAALMACAAASERREFSPGELPTLCEFVLAQLHPFPRLEHYRPHEAEPSPANFGRVGLVLAHSGFGKSSWAGEVGTHSGDLCVYFQCIGVEDELIAPRLVREAVALIGRATRHPVASFVLPGIDGLEPLTHLDEQAAIRAQPITFIVDDAHRLSAKTIVEAILRTKHVKWILLATPGEQADRLAARLNISKHYLGGWSLDTIAAALAEHECSSTISEAAVLKKLTGGAPLFVVQAAEAISRAGVTTAAFVEKIESSLHTTRTGQEVIIDEVLSHLPRNLIRVAAAVAGMSRALLS